MVLRKNLGVNGYLALHNHKHKFSAKNNNKQRIHHCKGSMGMKNIVIGLALLISLSLYAEDRYIVQINDKGETIPPNSVATPVQVQELGDKTASLRSTATTLREQAELCLTKVKAYATNTIVTSTCYAQSIGGVPYNPDLQTIKIRAIDVKGGNVVITGTLAVVPLIPPVLDWRYKSHEGDWDKLAVDAVEVPVQAAWLEDSAKALLIHFPATKRIK